MRIKFKENEILFMQDFSFYKGIPVGVWFEVEETETCWRLRAHGYGILGSGKSYGNGVLFVKKALMEE